MQGTDQPRPHPGFAAEAGLRRVEVRAVLNRAEDAGLARPLDPADTCKMLHDFIAHSVACFVDQRWSRSLRRATAYTAAALLVIGLFGGAGAPRAEPP